MDFDPNNHIVKTCLLGMSLEDKGNPEEAGKIFFQAWSEATTDFEKFLAAYYIAMNQKNAADRLAWLETALQRALKINDTRLKLLFLLYIQASQNARRIWATRWRQKRIMRWPILTWANHQTRVPFFTARKPIYRLVISS